MIRCVVRPDQIDQTQVTLDLAQSKHLSAVLRLKAGDTLAIVSEGAVYQAVLQEVSRRGAVARLGERLPAPVPLRCQITLSLTLPHRSGLFDQTIDQATQLGVAALIPTVTQRTVVRPDPKRLKSKLTRWNRIAKSACAQSGWARTPSIANVTSFKELVGQFSQFDQVWVAALDQDTLSIKEILGEAHPKKLLFCIGPEGDFTSDELECARQAEAKLVSLGPAVLRCETAAVAALSVLNHELNL